MTYVNKFYLNEKKFLNIDFPWFSLLFILGVIYWGVVINYYYFLFFIFVFFIPKINLINVYQKITYFFIIFIFCLIVIFVPFFNFLNLLNESLKILFGENIKKVIFHFFDNNYQNEISSFIKLILFNVHEKSNFLFFKQTIDLGIVWMICISGFHLSLIVKIINLIFNRFKLLRNVVNVFVITFYSYLLNFSYSSIRVLLNLYFTIFFSNKYYIKNFQKLGLIGVMICILNPNCFSSFSFLLSFIGCFVIYFVESLKIDNKLINIFCINSLNFFITLPLIFTLNNKISLFTLLNSFVFSYFFSFIFVYFLFFAWFPFLYFFHYWLIQIIYFFIGNYSFFNIFLKFKFTNPHHFFSYYLVLISSIKLVLILVRENKYND